jgi:hypothetical protein
MELGNKGVCRYARRTALDGGRQQETKKSQERWNNICSQPWPRA